MKLSLVLLAAIIAACVAGSMADNPTKYFKSWWVIAITAVLCLNLTLCSVIRFPVAMARYKRAVKRRIGAFGTWICHLGMLMVIIGFAIGQFASSEYTVYGIPGSIQPIEDTGYYLHIDDFEIEMRDDYTVEQYTAKLTMVDSSGKQVSGEASVNYPMSAFGYELYQDSTGWASYVDVSVGGTYSKTELICAGETVSPDDRPELKFLFNKFYPDMAMGSDGNPVTLSPVCNNPYSLFTIYYRNEIMGMNVIAMDEPIVVNEYTFVMHDPVEYTLIVIKKDPTALMVGIAAVMMLIGIFMAFYYRPVYPEIPAIEQDTADNRAQEDVTEENNAEHPNNEEIKTEEKEVANNE